MKKNHLSSLISHLSSCKGFTLIELLITIAIIGILAGGAFVGINPLEQINKAKDANKRMAVSQLVTALELYATQNGDKYPQAVGGSSGWITTLVNDGELKDVPSAVPAGSSPCAVEQNGYCYKTNASRTEAIVYAPLETSTHPSGTTPYFLWSSAGGESGTYYSVSADITSTSGFVFGLESSLTQGLVGWWKMNGNASDSSGNSNHGTVNGATLTTDKNGQANKAYSFNSATSDYINVPAAASLDVESAGSVEAWFKPAALYGGIVNRDDGGGHYGNDRLVIFNGDQYHGTTSLDAKIGDGNNAQQIVSDVVLTNGTWYHIALTWDGTRLKIYINGVLKKDDAQTVTPEMTGYALKFGYWNYDGKYLNGSLDDVRIYNRALSSDEITNLYNAGPQ